ncbi:MAG: DNA polymerase III subunit gamma/tau [Spirochaetota bacterium]
MSYEITATRKRPKGFEELAGQDFVSATLIASLQSGRLAHAYLFSGPRGCGKTSTARILAKALNCEQGPSATPCGLCSSCTSIADGSSLSVIEIDGASNTSVDNVRQIKEEVLFAPNGTRYKVYIIDEVHMLSMSAFNALLKTIEEPPPYVIFIFATTELHKVPATIKSRCQQFAFKLISLEKIKALLRAVAIELSVEAEDEALLWIAKESGGSLRDAYTLFDQIVAFSGNELTALKIKEKLGLVGLDAMNSLFETLVAKKDKFSAYAVLENLDALLARGVSVEQLVMDALDYLRSMLLLANGMGKESLLGAPESAFSHVVKQALDSERIERGMGLLLELHRNLRTSPNQRFELELIFVRLCRLRDFVSPSELASAVAVLRSGSPSPASGLHRSEDTFPSFHAPARLTLEEKKKPELKHGLPLSLSSAFSDLAGTMLSPVEKAEFDLQHNPSPRHIPSGAEMPHREVESATEMPIESEIKSHPDIPSKQEPILVRNNETAQHATDGIDGKPFEIMDIVALRKEVLARISSANPLLGSGLGASLSWAQDGEKLLIPFRTGMEEGVVRTDLAKVAQVVATVSGKSLKIDLRVAEGTRLSRSTGSESAIGTADAATIVERMFRGQRIVRKERGGSDEYR